MTKGILVPRARRIVTQLQVAVSWIIVISLTVIPLMIIVIFFEKSKPLPTVQKSFAPLVIDQNGETINSSNGRPAQKYVHLNEIASSVIQATLAIEDRRFWVHWGVDWQGLIRAFWVNLTSGEMRQGGSTITQQLARNLYLSHEKTWFRKWSEARLAIRLEGHKSKKEILEQYLNHIYYGNGCYGIESAAKYYFQKSASQLSLAESALLAGIPKGPSLYAPDRQPIRAKNRQTLVLKAMRSAGMIQLNEYIAAFNANVVDRFQKNTAIVVPVIATSIPATKMNAQVHTSAFYQYVVQEMDRLFDNFTHSQQVTVQTTLDLRLQKIGEELIEKELNSIHQQSNKNFSNKPLQAALIALDPRNGAIRAMIGSRPDYNDSFNRTTQMIRQPGSTFKPILYLSALKQRWTAVTRLRSEPTIFTYDEGRHFYRPNNFNDQYPNKEIDMRRAISESDNIYAVKALMAIGPDRVIQTARHFGIQSDMESVPSLALGSFPLRPIELATAYAGIANGGQTIQPYSIESIKAREQFIYQFSNSDSKPIFHPNESSQSSYVAESFVLTQLMQSVFEPGGTANRVRQFLHRPVAAKTGTTRTDAWMAGFTPELVVVVWIGYDQNQTLSVVEARKAAPIFARFIEAALRSVPPKPFEAQTSQVTAIYVDPTSGKQALSGCKAVRLEWFVKGTEPTGICGQQSKQTPSTSSKPMIENTDTNWWQNIKRWWLTDNSGE